MSHIIICEEKHSTRYWDASTHEAWAVNALAILTERWNQGYWYHEARRETEYDRQHRAWYEHAKAVVTAQDTGDQTIGRGKWAREEPKAWVLLVDRSDHEYERVTIEQLETRLEVEKGLGALEP